MAKNWPKMTQKLDFYDCRSDLSEMLTFSAPDFFVCELNFLCF